ncbi:hypothetical protein QWY90_10710 [Flavobacterium paronense]|uniref:Uncharacterized protein n=1 Tax=Flavobacterium paronense TaxID=1392775 RepID=A0ABV5GC40_9FLAO|nr:hypothetical protein [Flavobacterium paronense]MDN3677780.1 hypothetical protein [Flavobacterium paronense]
MNSTNHEYQKRNLKNVSKTSIIFLGLVVLSFTNTNATTEFETQVLDQQESATLILETSSNNEVSNETDIAIFNPSAVIETTYVRTIENVIAENKLIIESKEETVQPLSIETTVEDSIDEDNQIIESTVSKEFFPLDFEKINSKIQCVKINNSNTTISVDIKL